jgi:hypothetical protein
MENYTIKQNGEIWRKVGKHCKVERLLKPGSNGHGYLYINMCGEGFKKNMYIHRLVALTYIQNPDNLPEVDHIDQNKSNNSVNNLRWVTRSQNAVNILWKSSKSGEKYISIEPFDNDLIIDFEIVYKNPLIKTRRKEFKLSNGDLTSIYNSRTTLWYRTNKKPFI